MYCCANNQVQKCQKAFVGSTHPAESQTTTIKVKEGQRGVNILSHVWTSNGVDSGLHEGALQEAYEKSDTTTRTQRGSLNDGNPITTNPNAKPVKQVKSQVHNECKIQ